MRKRMMLLAPLAWAWLVAPWASAQELVIFPAKDQSPQQQEQDKFTCYSWAKGESGFDPMALPTATQPPPPDPDTSVAGGAAKGGLGGALLGLGIGALAGGNSKGAGTGAAIGALAGGLFGGFRSHETRAKEEQEQQTWANQQASQYLQKRSNYNRAYTACLEGKGYVVK